MKKIILIMLSFIFSTSLFAIDLELDPKPTVAVGVRGGTNSDINQSPAPYGSLKMTHYSIESGQRRTHFLVPGIGIQSAKGSTKINLSVAPVMFEGNQGWSFGIDIFTGLKDSNSGKSNYGFFIGKAF